MSSLPLGSFYMFAMCGLNIVQVHVLSVVFLLGRGRLGSN